MHSDLALDALFPYLCSVQTKTLWYADEHTEELIKHVKAQPLLTVVTNRFDIYQLAKSNALQVYLSDFNKKDYDGHYDRIVYRISKEKALVNHILKQSGELLSKHGQLILSGFKQEGIKSYGTALTKQYHAQGRLKKEGQIYIGEFTLPLGDNTGEDNDYSHIQQIKTGLDKPEAFFSKPGVYGWKKIDRGTNLLLSTLNAYIDKQEVVGKTVLDLGCGYGWLFLNLDDYAFEKIVATDNNVAAINCAIRNSEKMNTPVELTIDDCGANITTTFNYIFCNPPFHQGFSHKQALTEKFIAACRSRLKPDGEAVLVINEFIRLSDLAKRNKLKETLLAKENGFKVILLEPV